MGATPRYPCLLLRHNAPPADTVHHKHTPQRLRNTALGFLANTVQFSLFFILPPAPPAPIKDITSLGKPVVCQSQDCPGILRTPCPFCELNVSESISSSTGDNCYTRRDIHFSPVEGAGARLPNPVNRQGWHPHKHRHARAPGCGGLRASQPPSSVNKGMLMLVPLWKAMEGRKLPEHCVCFRTKGACFQGKVLSVYLSNPFPPSPPPPPTTPPLPSPNLFLGPWHCDEVFRIYLVGKIGEKGKT